MKLLTSTGLTATALFAVLIVPAQIFAQEQPAVQEENSKPAHYTIVDLGSVGGSPGQPYDITNSGVIAGAAATRDGAMHAALWFGRVKIDIGKSGLGGPNNVAFGINEIGQVVGEAQSLPANHEDFCGFNAFGLPHTDLACLPFLWQDGVMTSLPTLGGPNGVANMINDHDVAVGFAQTNVQESDCPTYQFKPVVWKDGKAYQLPTFKGDAVGVAAWINDKGQVVGSSGACAAFNANSGLYLVENHALLWDNGQAKDLGNLGGTGGIAGNHSCAINNRGEVVGHSELANDTTFHGFLWTKERRMQDLGTLSGDYASIAVGINDAGTVVGASLDVSFTPRAYVWKNGGMTDLNKLIDGTSALYLLLAETINGRGEIVGLGVSTSGELHGFLAIPRYLEHDCGAVVVPADSNLAEEPLRPVLSESARQLLKQHIAQRYHIALP
jgi:probable HAF family extracellular repeat protein